MSKKVKVAFIILLAVLAFFIFLTVSFNWESGEDPSEGMQPMGIVVLSLVGEGYL